MKAADEKIILEFKRRNDDLRMKSAFYRMVKVFNHNQTMKNVLIRAFNVSKRCWKHDAIELWKRASSIARFEHFKSTVLITSLHNSVARWESYSRFRIEQRHLDTLGTNYFHQKAKRCGLACWRAYHAAKRLELATSGQLCDKINYISLRSTWKKWNLALRTEQLKRNSIVRIMYSTARRAKRMSINQWRFNVKETKRIVSLAKSCGDIYQPLYLQYVGKAVC